MRPWRSPVALRRAFLVVLALRYAPTGLLIPVIVLLMTEQGLDLAEVGLATAALMTVVLALEVPTGGLADAVGSRPVLALASVLAVLGTGLLLLADDVAGFVLAWAVVGAYRALDSGPLEAWYVDAALRADPGRDLEGDLSRAGVVTYSAMGAGAATASAIALLAPGGASPVRAVVLGSLAVEVLHLLAVLLGVREDRPRHGARAVLREARGTGAAVLAGASLCLRSRPLRLVVLVELGWGAGLAGVELLWQPRTAALLSSVDAAAVTGLVSTAGLAVGAVGASLLPLLLRALRGRLALAAALLLSAQAAAVLVLGLTGLAGVIVGYVAFYGLHGTLNAAHASLLHRRTPSGRRATVLSLNSLVARTGGLPAGIALGALADAHGAWAFVATAGLLALAAPLYLASGEAHATAGSTQGSGGGTAA